VGSRKRIKRKQRTIQQGWYGKYPRGEPVYYLGLHDRIKKRPALRRKNLSDVGMGYRSKANIESEVCADRYPKQGPRRQGQRRG